VSVAANPAEAVNWLRARYRSAFNAAGSH
jgi:hypothetical protein